MKNMPTHIQIVEFEPSRHGTQVEALWQQVFGYDAPRNAPSVVIGKKCAVEDGLFFVAMADDVVLGTVMAGYQQ